MKREAINHTKMRRLARALGVKMWGARGIMESVWSLTRDEAPAGNIGKLSDADIADFVGWDTDPAPLIEGLVTSGWVDQSQSYRLLIHDWPDHCEDYVHSKLALAGLLFANGALPKTRKLNQEQRKSIPCNPVMPSCDGSAPVAAMTADWSAPVAAENAVPCLTIPNHTQPIRAARPPNARQGAETVKAFARWWERWCEVTHRQVGESDAAQAWLSMVTPENEAATFGCLESYLASGEVAAGKVRNPAKFIYEEGRNGWKSLWPPQGKPVQPIKPTVYFDDRYLTRVEEA